MPAGEEDVDTVIANSTDQNSVTRQLAGQSALLMMGNAFTLFVGFPFQIYVARVLGAKNLGAYGLFDVATQTISALFGLGVGHVVVRFLPQYLADGQTDRIRQLIRTVYTTAIIASLLAVVIALACRPWLLAWFESIRQYGDVMLLMSVMIPVGMLLGISQQALRGFFDIRYLVVMSSFIQLSLKVAFTILFFWLGMNLVGYVLAVVISSIVCLVGMLFGINRHLARLPAAADDEPPVDKSDWWKYGRVMYGNSLLGMVAAPLERTVLAGTIDLSAVGVLVVIRQLQTFPQIFLQVIIAIVAPMFVAAKNLTDVAHLYHLATDWMCRLALPMMLFFLIRGNAILDVYGAEFSTSGSLALAIILLAQTVNLGCGPVGNLLNMKGHQVPMFRINIVSSVLLLIGIITLVPPLGLIGIALATAISMVTANLWALRVVRSRLTISWFSKRYGRWIMPIIVGSCTLLIVAYVMPGNTKWWLCAEFAACFLAFHATYLFYGVSDEDREVAAMVRERLTRSRVATS